MKYANRLLGRKIEVGASDPYGNLTSINLTDGSSRHVRHRQTVVAESLNKNDRRHFEWTFTVQVTSIFNALWSMINYNCQEIANSLYNEQSPLWQCCV